MKHFISICMCVMLMFGVVGSVPPVSAEMVFADGYNGSTYVGSSTETIDYNTKSDTQISINGGLPKYYDVSVKKTPARTLREVYYWVTMIKILMS